MSKSQAQAFAFTELDEVLGVLDAGVDKVIATAQENVAKSSKLVAEVRRKTGDVRALKNSISSAYQESVVSPAANSTASQPSPEPRAKRGEDSTEGGR